MEKIISDKIDAKYYCHICNTQFTQKPYWKHMNRKNACVSSKEFLKVIDEKNKVINEKNIMNIENIQLKEKIEIYKNQDTKNKFNEEIKNKLTTMENKIDNHVSNVFVQTNNIDNIDNSKVINIKFAEPFSEKLDHINMDMMMSILDHREYDTALKELVAAVYFHPEAPQNWNWCITDLDGKNGALEYNHTSGNIDRNSSVSVINKNIQNIMHRIGEILDKLKQQDRDFNKPQTMNMNRLYGGIEQDLNPKQVLTIKKVAYSGRNLPKALWQYLNIMVEKVPITTRII
jgi:hypothetical protein